MDIFLLVTFLFHFFQVFLKIVFKCMQVSSIGCMMNWMHSQDIIWFNLFHGMYWQYFQQLAVSFQKKKKKKKERMKKLFRQWQERQLNRIKRESSVVYVVAKIQENWKRQTNQTGG
eukprot:TRINITY_DN4534_c1_g1_i1.p7 TRINITY_DN4534_c1_g1~~TRINITY_DN4534_c1_g1_i1.p7  ORF type:complete len:116 (+),score=1.20 TRINITY_DN4534_c1_g1_i1:831-1178(+)